MENKVSLHLRNFNDKVKLMNQTGKQNLVLSAHEARSLQSDIFDLLNQVASLSKQTDNTNQNSNDVRMDGGRW
jgi:hypothetical protein